MSKRMIVSLIFLVFMGELFAQRADNRGWEITTDQRSNYVPLTMANGRIGLVPSADPFRIDRVHLNGVYDKEYQGGVSKVLMGINFANLDMTVNGVKITRGNIQNWHQTLNMKEGSFTTTFDFGDKVAITHTVYALRNLPFLALISVDVKARKDVEISVANSITCPKEYKNVNQSFHVLRDLETTMPVFQTTAVSQFGKHELAASTIFIFEGGRPELKEKVEDDYTHKLSFEKKISKKETYSFSLVGSVCSTGDFNDPKSESERFSIFGMLEGKDRLIESHKQAWSKLWESDIVIDGDLQSQLDVRFALFNLYSFARKGTGLSIAPMGISSQGYNGHVFWDTELWMFPPLLVLNSELAESLLDYRFDRLGKAKRKAQNYGFKGAMYPWESDETGEEATPTWALTGTFEHHITADVGIAFWNYYMVTKDKKWLKEKGYPVLKEVADFWVSRAEKNASGTYSIRNVVGADEFAQNIDDNAFTNGSAIRALKNAVLAAQEMGYDPNPQWTEVANKIVLHKFPDGTVKEHKDYQGERIKQADVNLLSYPLQIVTDNVTILKNLKYYEPKMAEEGPAMSHSVLSILYSKLGQREKAFELFKGSYQPNQRPPFGVLSESAKSNNPYFATGAGGMLQAVIFGFAGLEITESGIIQNTPCLPKQWKSLVIKGVGPKKKTFEISK